MPGKGKRISTEEMDRIVTLYQSGMPMRQIAETIGRSYGAVNLVLHRVDEIKVGARGGYRRSRGDR